MDASLCLDLAHMPPVDDAWCRGASSDIQQGGSSLAFFFTDRILLKFEALLKGVSAELEVGQRSPISNLTLNRSFFNN